MPLEGRRATRSDLPLLERGAELAAFDDTLSAARSGQGGVIVIEGPPGIGKTRLLDDCTRQAEGVTKARAAGLQLERGNAFGIVRQLFEPLVRALAKKDRPRVLSGTAALTLGLFGLESGAPAEPDAMAHALYWLAAGLAEPQPLLLAVDDAHWADQSSLRWLEFLGRRLDDLPAIVAITAWPRAPGADPGPLESLMRAPPTTVVQPAPLSRSAVAELLTHTLGEAPVDELVDECAAATGGNAFLLTQLAAALAEAGARDSDHAAALVREIAPRPVADQVLARLANVGEDATGLAKAVAVLERDVELRQAAALAGLDPERAARASDALAAADILTPSRPLEFVHPIVRAAVYGDIPPGERALTHAAAAQVLGDDGAPLETVAAHLMQSDPAAEPATVELLRRAARIEVARGAPDAAAALLQRALREPPEAAARAGLLSELGAAELSAGDPAAAAHLAEAVEALEDPVPRAKTARLLAGANFDAGRLPEAVAVLDDAINRLGEGDRELALELEADLIGAGRLSLETRHLALDRLASHSDIGELPSPAERLLLAHMAAEAFATTGPAEHAVRLARQALSGDSLLEKHGGGSPVFEYAIYALSLGDQLDEALALSTRALELAVRRGSPTAFVRTLSVRAEINYRLGRVDDALGDARQGLDAMDEPADIDRKLLVSGLVQALIERGEQGEALAELHAHDLDHGQVETYFDNVLAHSRARVMVACGEVREGVDELLAVGARQEAWAAFNPAMIPWRSDAALALASLGEVDEARRLAAEELSRARSTGARRAVGIALVASALTSERNDQIPLLEDAVDTLEESPAALEHSRALTHLGAALRRSGRRADGREKLTAALDLAHRCGATGLAAQAREELLAAGSRPRRLALSGRDALTPSERRVAEMASQGMSNRDVAQALFVTVKTVEMHLGRAYRKLAIGSRGELAEALATPRPDDPARS